MNAERLAKDYPARNRIRRRSGDEALTAVDGVSLSLMQGESVGVIGESGSGKTTLALMISGLVKPTSGHVEVCGADRAERRPRRERATRGRELQIVFQDPYSSLDPRQSVESAIDEVLRLHFELSSAERRKRVSATLERVGLDGRRAQQQPAALSGGERQRVAIAKAIAAQPQVLVLDEAVSALDVSIQAQILNLLADLRSETGIAYLFLSHDLSVVRYITDRIVVMRRGRVVEEGVTEDVLLAPREPYTQLLLACVPRPGWKPQRVPDLDDLETETST